ncbi:MAG TPA: glucose-6-phosphate isomerase [Candidatus Nealsonbacteria bacterium]|uniref:glucose-6-phosphate isomerase n=1 Tax=marine sediment metagenome TaxID=412755 RepID=A0A0F9UJI3_9ZZZZ|nr:glucose-6-phosphate isomerase [Candidatus Nealsonbacteria bacterium]HEB46478.1 glucose-6-phosphate isomerase [Candidatus Nealsonbacteria bacterium]
MEIRKKPEIRFLNDMKRVVYDQEWLKKTANFEIYYMYRGIKTKGELRYDITEIKTKMLGKEFPKTKGHEHLKTFQEVYKVLKGKAIFLFQKYRNKTIEDVYAVRAKIGAIVIVPPYYGHITINASKEELKIANWISKKCKNSYNLFEKRQGACYYYTRSGWIKNKNYKKVPKLRFKKSLKKMPKNLDFLAPH